MRKVNLGFDFLGPGVGRAARLAGSMPISRTLEMRTNFLCFVLFERAGMRLLLGDTDFRQDIENGFALDFQLPGQIINPNLTHPPLCSSELVPLSLHINLA